MVGTNSSTYNTTTTGQYWVTVSSSSGGCFATSLKVTVKLKQAPIAKIKPVSRICLGGSGGATLQNRINEVNTSYTWSVLFAPTTVSFSPNGTNAAWFTTPTPGTAIAGDYIFVLTALNTISGCEAKDTICIKAYNKPVFTVSGVPGCAGVNNTFTASPAIPYNYLWSNGATGNIMTTSIAGLYDIMATDSTSGCSSDQIGVVLVKPKPNVSLFPLSGCDTLCNKDTLVPPLPLSAGGTYGSNYIINWYDGATLIYTGPYLVLNTLTPNPGQHNIHIVVTFIGSTCASTSGDYNVYIKNCDSCNCDNSSWGEITWQYNDAANKLNTKNANVPKPNSIKCGDKLGAIDCKKPITINAIYNCVGSNCTGAVNYSLTGAVTQSGSLPFTTNGLPQGSYLLTLYGICGTDTCKKCEFPFEIKCDILPECNCKGSQWGDKTYSIGNISQPIKCMTPRDKPIEVKCKIPISINANYNCADEKCNSAVTYTLVQPSGTTTGNLPLTFTPNQVGIYTITMNGYCGTVLCNTCIIKFKVSQCDTIPPPICCPYNISVKDPIITTNSLASPPATIANANFVIGGPGGNLFTEIRANVISYGLYDNFSNECINCKSYPYSWASMYKPGNVNSIPPAITMFNSTATAFNPSGNGVYQNPRELVWASNAPFALPANINLSFLLPAASIITCCELTAKICVKFTFRDNDCRECEVLVCFTVIIKPGGGSAGGGDSKDCTCDFKPMLNYEGGSKTLQCGDTLTLFQGKIPVSLQPNFTCKDSNGKACNSQPPSVTIKKNNGPATTLVGPLYNYTFLQSGLYQYSMVGLCAGKKCECKFIVKIP